MDLAPQPPPRPWPVFAAAALIAAAGAAAYANTFQVPFLLDDPSALAGNSSIRHLARLAEVLRPPETATTAGRPLLNFTFALNFAWGGLRVAGYHGVNLAIHLLAGLTLFGVVRRSALRRCQGHALLLAFVIALLWTLHPLQTEAVTYLSERAESLMGLFYLLTLYCFVRGVERVVPNALGRPATSLSALRTTRSTPIWFSLSISACFMGMATKEVMVTAPLLVLLYDRAFLSASFLEIWNRRRGYYAGLGATWLLLAGEILGSHALSHPSVGFSTGVSSLAYALTESRVIARYASLAAWPHPLVFDYGKEIISSPTRPKVAFALLLACAALLSALAWRRSRPAGFLATSFFLLLAPTSSLVPVAYQPMAESRMYLPLAAFVTLATLGAWNFGGRKALLGLIVVAAGFGFLTSRRNLDYRTALGLWTETVAREPLSSRAQFCLAHELARAPDRAQEAMLHYQEALRIDPSYPEAHVGLANLLATLPGRAPEALSHYEAALRLLPDDVVAHNNLGNELAKIPGRRAEAIAQYELALEIQPDYAKAHYNLANELAKIPGRLPDAIAQYETALQIDPDYVLAHNNLAAVEAGLGRLDQAIAHLKLAVALDPGYAAARDNLEKFTGMAAAAPPPGSPPLRPEP